MALLSSQVEFVSAILLIGLQSPQNCPDWVGAGSDYEADGEFSVRVGRWEFRGQSKGV
jgi:hypothetical protein